jgi:hypothetical protein
LLVRSRPGDSNLPLFLPQHGSWSIILPTYDDGLPPTLRRYFCLCYWFRHAYLGLCKIMAYISIKSCQTGLHFKPLRLLFRPVAKFANSILRALYPLLWLLRQIAAHAKKTYKTFVAVYDKYRRHKISTFKPYHYKPLSNAREIRLIRLERWKPLAEVICEIVHISLAEAPEYEVMSYTWGNPSLSHYVNVKAKSINPKVSGSPTTTSAVDYLMNTGSHNKQVAIVRFCFLS